MWEQRGCGRGFIVFYVWIDLVNHEFGREPTDNKEEALHPNRDPSVSVSLANFDDFQQVVAVATALDRITGSEARRERDLVNLFNIVIPLGDVYYLKENGRSGDFFAKVRTAILVEATGEPWPKVIGRGIRIDAPESRLPALPAQSSDCFDP